MLRAVPKGWFSWSFDIVEGEERIASVNLGLIREKGRLEIRGTSFEIGREGYASGDFFIRVGDHVVARADKPSAFRRRFEVSVGERRYTLTAANPFVRRFVLREGERRVGVVRPKNAFSHAALIDLPEEIPLAARVFMAWLVILMWRRRRKQSQR